MPALLIPTKMSHYGTIIVALLRRRQLSLRFSLLLRLPSINALAAPLLFAQLAESFLTDSSAGVSTGQLRFTSEQMSEWLFADSTSGADLLCAPLDSSLSRCVSSFSREWSEKHAHCSAEAIRLPMRQLLLPPSALQIIPTMLSFPSSKEHHSRFATQMECRLLLLHQLAVFIRTVMSSFRRAHPDKFNLTLTSTIPASAGCSDFPSARHCRWTGAANDHCGRNCFAAMDR